MNTSRKIIGGAVFSAAIVGSMLAATNASAATAQTTAAYNGACGSGYTVVNSSPVGSKGTVYLTYNSSTGRNCVVTVRNTTGTAVFMNASIALSDGSAGTVSDSGYYTSYAGPVSLTARGKCVDWSGSIQDTTVRIDDSNCGRLAVTKVTTTG